MAGVGSAGDFDFDFSGVWTESLDVLDLSRRWTVFLEAREPLDLLATEGADSALDFGFGVKAGGNKRSIRLMH